MLMVVTMLPIIMDRLLNLVKDIDGHSYFNVSVHKPVMANLHCRIRTGIPAQTQIPALYEYYEKGIRVRIQTNVKSFCKVLCSHRVWNLSPSPNPSLSPAM